MHPVGHHRLVTGSSVTGIPIAYTDSGVHIRSSSKKLLKKSDVLLYCGVLDSICIGYLSAGVGSTRCENISSILGV
jgi:hypothetical protein